MSKPREFWIEQIEGRHCAFSVSDMDGNSPVGEKFFVIEKSAADKLAEALSAFSPQDTTQGSLFVPEGFKNLVQLG